MWFKRLEEIEHRMNDMTYGLGRTQRWTGECFLPCTHAATRIRMQQPAVLNHLRASVSHVWFRGGNIPVANLTSPSKSLATQYLTYAGNNTMVAITSVLSLISPPVSLSSILTPLRCASAGLNRCDARVVPRVRESANERKDVEQDADNAWANVRWPHIAVPRPAFSPRRSANAMRPAHERGAMPEDGHEASGPEMHDTRG